MALCKSIVDASHSKRAKEVAKLLTPLAADSLEFKLYTWPLNSEDFKRAIVAIRGRSYLVRTPRQIVDGTVRRFSTGTSGEAAATSDAADLAPVSAEDVEEISPSVDAELSASPAEAAGTFRAYAPLPRFVPPRKRPTLPVERALQWVKENAMAKYDESVEIHIQMGVDPKRSDQVVRGMAVLPHGTGKKTIVAVFARGKEAEDALAAGADVVGAEDLVQKIKSEGSGAINFDRAIGHPSVMPILAPIARVLGPRGLMPNPKLGTLTTNLAEAVKKAKQGQVEF
eukprot:gene8265-9820_t